MGEIEGQGDQVPVVFLVPPTVTPTPTPTATPMRMTMITGKHQISSPYSSWRCGVNRLTNNPKAYPLLPPRRSCFDNGSIEVFISLVQIDDRVLCLLFGVLYSRLLRNDRRLHVLEELGELHHLPLNLLNSLVSALHDPQC